MTRQPHTSVLFHLSDSSCKSGLVWIFPKSQIASKVGFKSRHPPWFENHFGNDDFVITTLRQIQISQDTLARIIVQAKKITGCGVFVLVSPMRLILQLLSFYIVISFPSPSGVLSFHSFPFPFTQPIW